MGFWDNVLSRAGAAMRQFTPRVQYIGPEWLDEVAGTLTPAVMWKTQPHLRTVVSFRCENVSQLGTHFYSREADGGRKRLYDSPAARSLAYVDGESTTSELIYATVGDLDLYDKAFWWVTVNTDNDKSPFKIRRLPPAWVSEGKSDIWRVKTWLVSNSDGIIEVPADEVIHFRGYDPSVPRGESSPIDALRETIKEQMAAEAYRQNVWKNGGKATGVISRPKEAPNWSDAAKSNFLTDWFANFTGNGPKVGGVAMLEDGMTYQKVDFNAKEQQFVEVGRLAFQTVCGVYHINPSMVGQTESANKASVREYRKMLYGDNLGPLLKRLENRVNTFFLPMVGGGATEYFEFNLMDKVSGDFLEQGQLFSTSVGGPWMTRNEARSRSNMPAIEGGDEMIVPLNVVAGGQASPNDTGSQNLDPGADDPGQDSSKALPGAPRRLLGTVGKAAQAKSKTDREKLLDEHLAVLGKFFERQGKAVNSRLGAKSPEWWDGDRWDNELAEDLFPLHEKAVLVGAAMIPGGFDKRQVKNYLTATAENNAKRINATTFDELEDALDDEEPAPEAVFETAKTDRIPMLAETAVTFALAFGKTESGKQNGAVTKTWITTSGNSRPEHAMVDGETVPLGELFSNGADVPGGLLDPSSYGCQCELDINFP